MIFFFFFPTHGFLSHGWLGPSAILDGFLQLLGSSSYAVNEGGVPVGSHRTFRNVQFAPVRFRGRDMSPREVLLCSLLHSW